MLQPWEASRASHSHGHPPCRTRRSRSGQRKRVTTGEILCGPASAIMFDEISTGLDSATTYSVIQSFRHVAHAMRRTFVSRWGAWWDA